MEDGVYFDMPAHEYHAVDRISSTALKRWHESIASGLRVEDVSGPAVDIGTAVHALVETMGAATVRVIPEKSSWRFDRDWTPELTEGFDLVVAPVAGRNTNVYRDLCAAAAPGQTVLVPSEWDTVRRTYDAVRRNPIASQIVDAATHEVSVLWSDGEISAKARIDLCGGGVLGDLKTTGDARAMGGKEAVARLAYERGWHLQTSWYRQAAAIGAAMGDFPVLDVSASVILMATTKAPYVCEVVELDELFMDLGGRMWHHALNNYRAHMADPKGWHGPSRNEHGQPTARVISPIRWMTGGEA